MTVEAYNPPTYVREIDGLRAFAVLSVMLFHLKNDLLPGGFSGVDVFFVISGYVVSRALASRQPQPLANFLSEFFARRFVRILPALLFCLTLVCVVTVLFIPTSWLSSTTEKTGLWAFFGASNFALTFFQDDYFSARVEYNPFTHTWSLAVEEQFYLILPLALLVWMKWRTEIGWKLLFARFLLPGLAVGSLYTAYMMGIQRPDWAYYMLPARFWELASGVMLFQLHSRGNSTILTSLLGARLALAVGTICMFMGFWFCDGKMFPFPWALLPVIGAVLILSSLVGPTGEASVGRRLYGHGLIVYIGKISYSLYLWHWPVYVLFRWTLGLEGPSTMLPAVFITVVLAMVSYHFVELPVRSSRWVAGQPPILRILAGIAIVFALYILSTHVFRERERISLSVTANTQTWYPYDYPVKDVADGLKPYNGKNIFVIGNSHATAYTTMLSESRQRLGAGIRIFEIGACNMGNIRAPIGGDQACWRKSEELLALIHQEAKPGDIVFFASLRSLRLINQWDIVGYETVLAQSLSPHVNQSRLLALEEISSAIRRLREMGLNVLIDAPKPVFQAPPFRCSDWFNLHNPICRLGDKTDRAFLLDMRRPVMLSLAELEARFDNVTIWDPFPVLCPSEVCSAYDVDGRPIFFDGDHLSAHGNRILYPEFKNMLQQIWGPADSILPNSSKHAI